MLTNWSKKVNENETKEEIKKRFFRFLDEEDYDGLLTERDHYLYLPPHPYPDPDPYSIFFDYFQFAHFDSFPQFRGRIYRSWYRYDGDPIEVDSKNQKQINNNKKKNLENIKISRREKIKMTNRDNLMNGSQKNWQRANRSHQNYGNQHQHRFSHR
jgi:hypothetical protein